MCCLELQQSFGYQVEAETNTGQQSQEDHRGRAWEYPAQDPFCTGISSDIIRRKSLGI